VDSRLLNFPPKAHIHSFVPVHAIRPARLILLDLIILIILESYEAPHYAVFSNLLSFHPSSDQLLRFYRDVKYTFNKWMVKIEAAERKMPVAGGCTNSAV
jgi:hypothetical protein